MIVRINFLHGLTEVPLQAIFGNCVEFWHLLAEPDFPFVGG